MLYDVDLQSNAVDPYIAKLAEEARDFLLSMEWCHRVCKIRLYKNIEDLAGLFWITVSADRDVPAALWVMVGDLPPAVLPPEHCLTGEDAIVVYIEELEIWSEAVKEGNDISDLMPFLRRGSFEQVEPTSQNADLVMRRATLLRTYFLGDSGDGKRFT